MSSERWAKIPGVNYSASTAGRVRNDLTLKILKPFTNGKRLSVDFRSSGGRARTLHAVIAEVFIGARPKGMQVNHIDGNQHNNRVENLEYVTPLENISHSMRNKLSFRSKMNERLDNYKSIMDLLSKGYNQTEVARILGFNPSHISRTANGKAYAYTLSTGSL